jgi:UDP-2-acetamido-3-amino-2,3-dideoxy-glucuronate N-acetyltransferase
MSTAVNSTARRFFAHPQALIDTEEIGERTRVWAFAHVMAGARIGTDCNIGEHAFIEDGATVGNHVIIKNGVSVWSGITVEDNVFLGPHCVLTNDLNPRANVKKSPGLTLIRAHASIGANATVLCGITVGRYALVGAGAVVLGSVPDYGLVVGNPARQIGWMCACATKLPFEMPSTPEMRCVCEKCGRSFVAIENKSGMVEVKEA